MHSIREMCRFMSKTLIKRCQPGQRQTIQHEGTCSEVHSVFSLLVHQPAAAAVLVESFQFHYFSHLCFSNNRVQRALPLEDRRPRWHRHCRFGIPATRGLCPALHPPRAFCRRYHVRLKRDQRKLGFVRSGGRDRWVSVVWCYEKRTASMVGVRYLLEGNIASKLSPLPTFPSLRPI